jgi:hypothetical protein
MRNKPEFVIVHHSATADTDERQYDPIRWWHMRRRGWRDIGYHRVYELARGEWLALAGRPLNMTGAHCPGYNARSIGVCFVGNYSDGIIDSELLHVGARDIAGICETLGIPIENILPHKSVRHTECPGAYFPFGTLRELVRDYIKYAGEDLTED